MWTLLPISSMPQNELMHEIHQKTTEACLFLLGSSLIVFALYKLWRILIYVNILLIQLLEQLNHKHCIQYLIIKNFILI